MIEYQDTKPLRLRKGRAYSQALESHFPLMNQQSDKVCHKAKVREYLDPGVRCSRVYTISDKLCPRLITLNYRLLSLEAVVI